MPKKFQNNKKIKTKIKKLYNKDWINKIQMQKFNNFKTSQNNKRI